MTKAIAEGWPKLRIEETAAKKQAKVRCCCRCRPVQPLGGLNLNF